MFIEQLSLENFRCFESLTIPFDRHLNVFVGGNGSGKTTILDSLCLALAPVLSRLPFEKRPKVPSLHPSDIRLTSDDLSAPQVFISARGQVNQVGSIDWDRARRRDKTQQTKQQSPKLRHDLKELHQYIDSLTDAQNTGKRYELPVFAYYSTNRAVDVPHYRLRKQKVPSQFRRLSGLRNALENNTDFRHAVGWFDFFEQQELRAQRDKNIVGRLPSLDAVCRAIISMIREIRNPRIDGATGRFTVDTDDPNGTKIKLHLDQLSDGYQVMLGVVMDFALRLALANPPEKTNIDPLHSEAILIIDEVDLHLHPSWQQRIIPDLRRTFPNTQLILTTHSPQVATTVPSDNLRILAKSRLHSAPAGTEGAEAQRLLEDVFIVKPRPPVGPAAELDEYLRLIDKRQWESTRAKALRQKLDIWSKGQEPRLVEADLQIENMKWEASA